MDLGLPKPLAALLDEGHRLVDGNNALPPCFSRELSLREGGEQGHTECTDSEATPLAALSTSAPSPLTKKAGD